MSLPDLDLIMALVAINILCCIGLDALLVFHFAHPILHCFPPLVCCLLVVYGMCVVYCVGINMYGQCSDVWQFLNMLLVVLCLYFLFLQVLFRFYGVCLHLFGVSDYVIMIQPVLVSCILYDLLLWL